MIFSNKILLIHDVPIPFCLLVHEFSVIFQDLFRCGCSLLHRPKDCYYSNTISLCFFNCPHSQRDHKQSLITKSFCPHVVHGVYKQNLIAPVKHAHFKGQALLLSHWIGQAGACMDKMCPS